MTTREAAHQYARNNWPIFPLHNVDAAGVCSCGGQDGCKPGKHPRISAWQTAVCSEAQIHEWWETWHDANIGLRLDTLTVLDVDVKPGEDGYDSLTALEKESGTFLEPLCKAYSGGGGTHNLFQGADGAKHLKFRPGLDLLSGQGNYIVVGPSTHASGKRYQWFEVPNPLDTPRSELGLTPPPAWVLNAAKSPTKPQGRKPARPAGERKPAAFFLDLALKKIDEGVIRNEAGMFYFCQLRDEGYSKDEAFLELRSFVDGANERAPKSHRYTREEAKATLHSVYKRDARDPFPESRKPNHADILLGLIGDFEYFKSGPANEGYVRMGIAGHREVWRVSDKDPKVREVLTHRFLLEHDRAPSREALNTVVDTIMAKCSMGAKVDVHVRFARTRDVIYLDLADEQWRAVEITKDQWRIVNDVPVLFRRAAGARPLPVPVKGGSLDQLRPLVNCGDDSQWLLMVAWLVGVFLPEGAFVHLALNGEQGSAKSSTSLSLLSLLDPSDAGLTSPPPNEEAATVSGLHAGLLVYDNMSGCRAELSDTFCRFSTGQGFRSRTLYSNLGVTVASIKLPIIMNGISSTVLRGDLAARCIMLKLPVITEQARLTETGVSSDFAVVHPGILGALLDVVATGLRNLPHTVLNEMPRMSDFALWLSACEPALPWPAGQFMRTYLAKMKSTNLDLVEADTVASAIVEWAEKFVRVDHSKRISTRDLLTQLNEVTLGWPKDMRYWPASAEDLAHKLVRLAPVLRAEGVHVRKMKRTASLRSHWEISLAGSQVKLIPEAA
jgi:hypothetical protein